MACGGIRVGIVPVVFRYCRDNTVCPGLSHQDKQIDDDEVDVDIQCDKCDITG